MTAHLTRLTSLWPPFAVLASASPVVAVAFVDTEHAIIADVIARLVATGAFDEDAVVGYEAEGPASAGWGAMARVLPGDTDEVDIDPETIEVHGRYEVAIVARDEDPADRDARLARCRNAARNALNDVSLADSTLPGLTMIREPRRPEVAHPQAKATLRGEYTYLVERSVGFTASE